MDEDAVFGDEVDDLGFPDLGIVFEGVQADQVLDSIRVEGQACFEVGLNEGFFYAEHRF